ncbi:MAG TPA: acyl-CoA dehydrogenase family protein [Tenuifilaceae bacterium]|jgi:alkylation response protein AidB-like acyl-CoA dehydrogenase|nr:acyl-CoA dehydrogenase family protein [Bacteroidota bacterium]MZP82667.1 acyl-CoA dehydrogenase [Bacteroidales bacterium]NLH57730.1 acyl-CoA dehydrogenase [Rikenellaceae bacterium]OQC63425.1 MAG: putative acyl-CoA dehydrogenase [Bacteroidetes bacterium ADurb.Bin008]HNV82483.1 acyl-CoA dehydrogenase family protein [Tenuifilaceae bacterium]HRU78495.1 acyl-CoA dehydrogenase family protein [Rectinema sp.]
METVKMKSGEFLVKDIDAKEIFIPEEFNEEQRMIAQTCRDFMDAEVFPNLDKIDKGDRELMKGILHKAAELGMLGIAVPEEYNGFGQDFVTQMLVAETTGAGYSFSVAYMCHCGIGTMPILYYGNNEQRLRYVSRLATGELIGSYCLTEPGAGSDANSGKTNARLSEDGKHYILNGQKMWITNGGFADTQVVFAKIDNDRILSAFIVESNWPGVVIGPDEHKMGIKGSSTTQIYYNDVKVPVENMLGARGEGFRIALSILHMGRMKLGANVIGAAKQTITDAVRYANERKQFGVLISTFGAIKHKLAQMVIKAYAQESAIYRVSKDVDNLINQYKSEGCDHGRAGIDGISHYAVEDAILKVWGSEMLDFVVDEGVQIHGGMGYSAEMNIDRGYRDSRINRIFEGTNEINRLLVVESATKRAMKGEYDLFGPAKELYENLDNITDGQVAGESYFDQKKRYMKNFKKAIMIMIHATMEKLGKKYMAEQEVVNNLANMIMELYMVESMALRIEKLESINGTRDVYRDMLNVFTYDTAYLIRKNARDAIYSITEGKEADALIKAIKNLTHVEGVNTMAARRRIADRLIEDNEYKF